MITHTGLHHFLRLCRKYSRKPIFRQNRGSFETMNEIEELALP